MVLALLASALAGCSPQPATPAASSTIINGAGATFPYPIYSKWAYAYEAATGVKVNYQSIGSGGGISQIKNKTVDFGASDSPLTSEELNEAKLVQFPLVVGGIVPVVHIEGVATGKLRLTSKLLADIFLGRIKNWDDAEVKAANPDLKLPAKEIAVVHRADGSGTTWIFTSYLAETSADWKEKVGVGKSVSWPAGIGGKGNEGVAAYVNRIDGAIGYVEYAYALQNKMPYALLQNREGKYPEPTIQLVSGGGGQCRLEERSRLLRRARQSAGRDELADNRRLVHSDS